MRTKRMNGLLLLILALSSNACIVTYQVEQPTTMETLRLPKKDLTLYYSPPVGPYISGVSHNKAFALLMPGSYPLVSTGQGSDELGWVLASNDVFAQTTRTLLPNPPDQGLYCSILVWTHHSGLGEYLYNAPVQPGSKEEYIAHMLTSTFFLPISLTLVLQCTLPAASTCRRLRK